MAVLDNRPQLQSVLNRLAALPAQLLTPFQSIDTNGNVTYPLLEEQLAQSIAWVEDQGSTAFNPTWVPYNGVDAQLGVNNPAQGSTGPVNTFATLIDGAKVGLELADGNTTNQVVTRKRPVLDVAMLQVTTPILGYTRVYTSGEIKAYVRQGVLKVFTYKLAVEQALLQTIDYQAWGNLFPPLPQAVQIAYCWGFPAYDPASEATDAITGLPINGAPATSLDGGHSWFLGDQRDPELSNWLTNLQEAAICETCAKFLDSAMLKPGVVSSVSFDGYSRSLTPQLLMEAKAGFEKTRDERIGRRKRQFYMATLG